MTKKLTSMDWLYFQMSQLGYTSLEQVASAVGINRGNLWRYFRLETRPSIGMLPPLCEALDVDVNTLLRALEIIGPRQSL